MKSKAMQNDDGIGKLQVIKTTLCNDVICALRSSKLKIFRCAAVPMSI